ncbi:39S ribosomal protein L22, mitochondrial-like [Strongylocentrotus purpuratus]|uniref:Large ribosomal subunit protein uL22m n=1 Tax=Strongylocentrotus purpuratus TaxID=7668 RepID=A0A7M7SWQ4_STRPU|nr:39S ribosomal protein L22, mitochondrial-like [Strongylocentrotus purpuratus]
MSALNLMRSLKYSAICQRTFSAAFSVQHFGGNGCAVPRVTNYVCLPGDNPLNANGLQPVNISRHCDSFTQRSFVHTSSNSFAWDAKNKKVYPPQKPGEPRNPAEIYYSRKDIKHSQRKMWYITTFIKGMMIDDAVAQLEHVNKKAAKIAREVLLEAQEEAVKNHNVEFKSNLHIAEALVGKGKYQHAIRFHAKGRASMLDLVYCHLNIKLQEGPPPEKPKFTGYDQAKHYIQSKRNRTIIAGL